MELTRLKRELAEVKMEREILKKAAAYFYLVDFVDLVYMDLIMPLWRASLAH